LDRVKRIQLLTDAEISDLYDRPIFTTEEREWYFNITQNERTALENFHNHRTKVYFILQLGYFKAKRQFFNFAFDEVVADTGYILATYFGKTEQIEWSGKISRDSIRSQKKEILSLFGFRDWLVKDEAELVEKTADLLRYFPKGHSAFRQLLQHLERECIVIPSYRMFQDVFTAAYAIEDNRLKCLLSGIPIYWKKQLTELIEQEEGLNHLNLLRADQKDFQYTAVRFETEKAESIADMYTFAEQFLPTLKLSKNAIRYFADIVEQYAAFRLRRITKHQQWLHALCYVYHRYQQIMDNLIVTFLYHTRAIMDSGKAFAEQEQLKHSNRVVVDFPKLANFLKWFPDRDNTLSHEQLNDAAYQILPKNQFSVLADFLAGNAFDKLGAKWKYFASTSRLISLYLRPIVLAVPFTYHKEESEIANLISLLKNHYGKGKSPAALRIADDLGLTVPKRLLPYLKRNKDDEYLDPHLFEFFVYQKIYHQINRGNLCCNASVSYCDIDHDLINDNLVDNAEEIAQEFGYPKIPVYCSERLDNAMTELDLAWDRTTGNIKEERNPGFKFSNDPNSKTPWRLLYDSSDKREDAFFSKLPKTELADVVVFIGELSGMWRGFTHLKDRYIKRVKPQPLALNACILSDAFGFGIGKMAEMCDLEYNTLRSTQEDFVRIETICAANDHVSNFIKAMPIFEIWNLLDEKVLADADGQKIGSSNQTIQSRHSRKFFGKGCGISIYSLVANFVAVNARNLGLNEYEGHCLYDMVYGNKTDIDIGSVTGDNHSLNKLNFVVLDSIDVDYLPSIKNVREASQKLYSINSSKLYAESPFQPVGYINEQLIRSQARGIQRVLLSLILQENTQSHLIRKLNSHTRYARLRSALYEYNKIFRSTHVLNLIDDMNLRKAIRTARNRTEAYHQLQSLIRKMYNGIFKGRKVTTNRVSAHAARLVANCIVAYNALILNAVYEKMVEAGVSKNVIEEFARISPIAWRHLFFTGRYSFKKASKASIDVEGMAALIEKHLKEAFWKD
jgi:TnpA family transposase